MSVGLFVTDGEDVIMQTENSCSSMTKAMGIAAVVLAVTGSAALSVAHADDGDVAGRHSARHAAGPPVGTWRMDGYGAVLSVGRDHVQEYQTTKLSCLKGTSADRAGGHGGTARYEPEDGQAFTLRSSGGRSRAAMHLEGSEGDRKLRRIEALPDACARTEPKDPVKSFDVFWQTFDENYPFFAAKGVDWDAVRDRYRPQIDSKTTQDELFAVFRKMVTPLYDAHVAVLAGETGTFGQVRPGTEMPTPELDAKVRKFIEERDLKDNRMEEFGRGRIGYADLPGGQGYLRVLAFIGYTKDGGYASQRAELQRALDAVLTTERTEQLKGLIIDLRVNGGGSDTLGLE
ncbi:MAG TPA: hypothetical protein VGO89_10440, partial [Streptomyces sp.]|nr:hypothetical protein [Streptomyces sp.]